MHYLLQKYPLISDQVSLAEVDVILRELEAVLASGVTGDVVEFGCYAGTTSLFLQRCLAGTSKQLHVYDSFAGLPPKTAADLSPAGEQFKPGELSISKAQFIANFKKARLPLPIIHKGWFDALTPDDLPQQIAFAFLDRDFYESIHKSLQLVWPRLAHGAIVVVDDFQSEALPGAQRAVREWLAEHPAQLSNQASLAIIKR